MIKYFFIFLLTLVLSIGYIINGSSALGISPSRTTIDFVPNLQETREFYVLNNEDREITIEFYKKGDLVDYLSLNLEPTTLKPNEKKFFSYEIKLPESLEGYGIFDTRIGAREAAPEDESMMGARAAVESQLWIIKLQEGTYVEIYVLTSNGYADKPFPINVKASNFGTENATCNGILEILYSEQKVVEFSITQTEIKSKETASSDFVWDAKDASAGEHKAEVRLLCNDKEFLGESSFTIIKQDSSTEKIEDRQKTSNNEVQKETANEEGINIYIEIILLSFFMLVGLLATALFLYFRSKKQMVFK